MAVSASSEPAIPSDGKDEIKKKSKKKNKTDRGAIDGLPSPPRRNKAPGVRVVHGRVYDSEHGRTCHQCRQKTRDFAAACKNVKENDKICPINFCHKCLLNRYGEKAEEVMEVEDWKCPKCRGICNCSFCMKKRGQQPTGILVHTAKATGFSSVSELLQQRGPDELGILKVAVASEKSSVSKEHGKSKRKVGKENHNRVEEVCDQKTSDESVKETHLKKRKRECGTGIDDECCENGELVKKKHRKKKFDRVSEEVAIEVEEKCMGIANTGTIIEAKPQLEPKSPKLKKHVAEQSDIIYDEVVTKVGEKGVTIAETDSTAKAEPQLDPKVPRLKKNVIRSCTRIVDMNVVLPPQCIGLTTLVGVDLPTDDIGSALQFLEFCRAFEKALHIRKGLPESVLREIVSGRRVGRRGRKGSSSILQVHIKLLRHIQKANGQESTLKSSGNSWIKALGKCITDAEYPPKDVPMDFLEGGAAGYDKLDSSMKLRILNFLCDETLGTQDLRNWIDEENSKFDEIKKEANARVLEAKKKEKLMKQMLKNEVAQTMISLRDGASLSINEHEALMSKIRSETEKALAEKLETINSVPKTKQRADAVRTEPIVLDDNGRAFWRLRGYSDGSYVVLQDVGDRESVIPQDKWFIYEEEHAKLIEQYISFLRKQRLAMHKVSLSSALQDDGMEE